MGKKQDKAERRLRELGAEVADLLGIPVGTLIYFLHAAKEYDKTNDGHGNMLMLLFDSDGKGRLTGERSMIGLTGNGKPIHQEGEIAAALAAALKSVLGRAENDPQAQAAILEALIGVVGVSASTVVVGLDAAEIAGVQRHCTRPGCTACGGPN